MQLVDVAGRPTFETAGDDWIFDFVAAVFGAYDESAGQRLISEFFLCVAKKNGKSTLAAAIMLTALIRNWRHSNELIIVAPTIEAAQNSFKPAADMVRANPKLDAAANGFLHIQDHLKSITHLSTKATLRVIAADTSVVAGKKAAFVLIDELWEFGDKTGADAMLREATGGLIARPEGFVISITTQSDKQPAGVFKDKLDYARSVRDGKTVDPKFLPVIHEFPEEMVEAQAYLDPANFYITNPIVSRSSYHHGWLADQLRRETDKGPETRNVFLAKHLNVEIGLNLRSDRWAGADFWLQASDKTLTLESLLERSEVVVIGVDGGGLDDLLGLAVLGREKETRRWLLWCRAWAHQCVLERRKEIAPRLLDFKQRGEVWIIPDDSNADVEGVADIVEQVEESGLLPKKHGIGVDQVGISDIGDELERRGLGGDRIIGVKQGWTLSNTIKTAERRLAGNDLVHDDSDMMKWSVGNAKVEPRGNSILITKQMAGSAKIDPLMASFNAIALMGQNPSAGVQLSISAMLA